MRNQPHPEPTLNESQFAEMQDLLDDDFVPLIEQYLKDTHTRLDDLNKAIDTGDFKQASDLAHTQKGASANIGASEVERISFQMQSASDAKDTDLQKSVLSSLTDAVKRSHQEINQRLAAL